MSSLSTETIKVKIAALAAAMSNFHEDIDLARERIALRGKTLEEANKEQATWFVRYYQLKAEADKICKNASALVDAMRGVYFQRYTENHSRDLSDRAKDKYVDKEDDVLACTEVYLEAKQLYDELSGICEAFTTRGYALRNITDLRVHEIHNNLL